MTFEDSRHALAVLQESSDSLVYAQFIDWMQILFEHTKDKVLASSPDDREMLIGKSLAYRDIISDLINSIQ